MNMFDGLILIGHVILGYLQFYLSKCEYGLSLAQLLMDNLLLKQYKNISFI